MGHFKLGLASAIAGLLFVGACATPTSTRPSLEAMSKFESGEMATIIFDARSDVGCDILTPTFVNLDNAFREAEGDEEKKLNWDAFATGRVYSPEADEPINPAMLVVEPGTYSLMSTYCTFFDAGGARSELPNVDIWFDNVEIGAGEIIYLGTLEMRTIDVQSHRTGTSRVMNALVLDFSEGDKITFPVYEMLDEAANVRAMLSEEYPDIAARMTTRMPAQLLSSNAVQQAYEEAYARNEDGTLPTNEEASARLSERIGDILNKSTDELLDRQEALDGAAGENDAAPAAVGEIKTFR